MTSPGAPGPDRPPAVAALDRALADWLAGFTAPAELQAAMVDACAAGGPWAGGVGAVAARAAGWSEAEALAWGIACGALAGALEATRASLEPGPADGSAGRVDPRATELLAADGLTAAAHEALSSLEPGRLGEALEALATAFGEGGPWRPPARPRPAWPAAVAAAVVPVSGVEPWVGSAEAWGSAFGADGSGPPEGDAALALWPDDDPAVGALLRGAAVAAGVEVAGGTPA